MRLAALAIVAVTLALPASAPAGILAPEDATEVANALAEAQEEQDVCYGWHVTNDFDGVSDVGSGTAGPGAMPIATFCERYVYLTGNIHYACGSCEDSDSASVQIDTNLVPAPTVGDLKDLGLDPGALTGDNDDVTLLNMIGALPLLAAQTGAVPALAAETPTAVPAGDVPTNPPGSDFLRESWLKLVLFLVLIASGVGFWFYKRTQLEIEARDAAARQKRLEGIRRLDAAEAAAGSAPPPPPPADSQDKET